MSGTAVLFDHHTHRGRNASSTRPTTTGASPAAYDHESPPDAVARPSPAPAAYARPTRCPRPTPAKRSISTTSVPVTNTTLSPRPSWRRFAPVATPNQLGTEVEQLCVEPSNRRSVHRDALEDWCHVEGRVDQYRGEPLLRGQCWNEASVGALVPNGAIRRQGTPYFSRRTFPNWPLLPSFGRKCKRQPVGFHVPAFSRHGFITFSHEHHRERNL